MGVASLSHFFKKLAFAALDGLDGRSWRLLRLKASVAPYGIARQVSQKQRIDLFRYLVGSIVAHSR